jgi:hypothetical protein
MRTTLLVVVVLAVAACGVESPEARGGAPGTPAPVTQGPASCPDDPSQSEQPKPPSGRLPDGFVPAEVVLCEVATRSYPGEGEWLVAVERRARSGFDELLGELRRPSSPGTAQACTLELVTVPWFALVSSDGGVVRPAVPTDECQKPRGEALAALQSLPYQTVAERRIRPVQSQQAIDTGCADGWKDVLVIEAEEARPGGPGPVFDRRFDRLVVCTYRSAGGKQLPGGVLSGGKEVRGEQLAELLAALEGVGPALSCRRQHSAFAVLRPGDGGEAYVELDGCRRVLAPDRTLRQANAQLIGLLTASS